MAVTYQTNATNSGTSTSPSCSKPASTVDGDLLIASIVVGPGSVVNSVPSGWALVYSNTNGNLFVAVYWKIAASEGASWTWGLDVNANWRMVVARIDGTSQTAPINASNGQTNASSVNVAAPSITSTVDGCLLHFTGGTLVSTTFTPPSGMTEISDNTTPGAQAMETARETQATAGATGTRTATAAAAAVNIGVLLAIAPPSIDGAPLYFGTT